MYISIEEQRKLFIKCLKQYSKLFIYLLILTVLGYVSVTYVPRNGIEYHLARIEVVLYMLLLAYSTSVLDKVETSYEHKPEERYATTYSFIILFIFFVCMCMSISLNSWS